MRAVRHHTQTRWILLYVERWLKAPVQRQDGSWEERPQGSPQGSVISPLMSNLFLHYAFDDWMRRNHPTIPFARYADDAIVHASSLTQAKHILEAIRQRLAQCGLELHPEKTKIVYCQDSDRTARYDHVTFDFLGYTFAPRRAKNRWGQYFVSFLPAISKKAANSMRATIRSWRLGATRNNQSLEVADTHGRWGEAGNVFLVQEVVLQLLFRDTVGGFVVELSQQPDFCEGRHHRGIVEGTVVSFLPRQRLT